MGTDRAGRSASGRRNGPSAKAGHPVFYLNPPRDELYARIDARVRRMIADGLVEEVRALRGLPRPLSREASQALGYKELFDHLDGRISLEEAISLHSDAQPQLCQAAADMVSQSAASAPGSRSFDIRRLGHHNRRGDVVIRFAAARRATRRLNEPFAEDAGHAVGYISGTRRDRQGPHVPRASHARHHRPGGRQRSAPQ